MRWMAPATASTSTPAGNAAASRDRLPATSLSRMKVGLWAEKMPPPSAKRPRREPASASLPSTRLRTIVSVP